MVIQEVVAQNNIRYEVPKYSVGNNEQVVKHSGFTLLHSKQFNVSRWVAYQLKAEYVQGKAPARKGNRNDPKVSTVFKSSDFASNIFDKGHQAPHKHLAYSSQTILEASYFTNITPQHKDLNGSLWVRLDKFTVRLANSYDSVYITTGCIFNEDFGRTKRNIAIPDAYFKAILIQYENEFKAIGFIIPNKKPKKTCLCSYAVTIDSLENLTGLDFFSQLDLTIQNKIESEIDSKLWGLCNDKCVKIRKSDTKRRRR